ncbi:MAG: DUF1109 domain-containing protein, partial [Alphaproteobacteria bacterium]|nr:DUF1109 domain-containing protein [Alphaproteobacteria bacterium]
MSRNSTDDLIEQLTANARPVRRLMHPMLRMLVWAALSFAFLLASILVVGPRPDLAEKLADTRFILEISAIVMTSLMAAAAALCSGCPGRPHWERYAPLPFLLIWLASLGQGCWQEISSRGTTAVLGLDLTCFEIIFLLSLVPAFVIISMVRRGAPLTPMWTVGLAMLAATTAAGAGLRFIHMQD